MEMKMWGGHLKPRKDKSSTVGEVKCGKGERGDEK